MRCSTISTLILATFLILGCSADVVATIKEKFDKVPAEFNNLMPEEISEYIDSLTPEDQTAWEAAAKKYKEFKNEDEFSDFIKKQSPELYKKASKLQDTWKDKLVNLSDDAKDYIQSVYEEAQRLQQRYIIDEIPSMEELKSMGKAQMEKYKRLSKQAKDSIASYFPTYHEMVSKARDVVDNIKDEI